MKKGEALLAVVAGIAAGATLGVLFTQSKGNKTRKKVSKKGEALADALNEKIDEKFESLLSSITGKVKSSKTISNSSVNKDELVG